MSIKRSEGFTASEKYLKHLCDNTFLSLWSYPNLYRDQGRDGSGKELCDLLVVFEENIIIFSDKYYHFPDTGEILLDWRRWFRHSVQRSADQIYGAERWIKNFPGRIFLDSKCTQRFPLALPNVENAKFYRVVVAHGARARCKEYFGGGSGSLVYNSQVKGDQHFENPFTVGQIDPRRGYIHVWDDVTMEILLNTLDTIADLVAYLRRKEKLIIEQGVSIIAAGEEDLLGYYLQQLDSQGRHDFILPLDSTMLVVNEGFWDEFVTSAERKAQIEANKNSYMWDRLIETFNHYILENTLHDAYPYGVEHQEQAIRILARENRLRRRILSDALLDLMETTSALNIGVRIVGPSQSRDPYYVFLLLPRPLKTEEEEYREKRKELLYSYCLVTKLLYPDADGVVGIATETGWERYRSTDLIYYDSKWWNNEERELAEYLHYEVGLLKQIIKYHHKEWEYPEINEKP